tara:strand:- start:643 stop:900 length:258 start_codon:yes stop_codon:yes gene_type:complete
VGKALFLSSRDGFAIVDLRGRAIMIKRGNSMYMHRFRPFRLEDCVDEGRDCGAFREDHEAAKQHHHEHYRQEPKLLAGTHKRPGF